MRIEKLLGTAIALNNRHAAAYTYFADIRSLLGVGEPVPFVRRAIGLEPSDPNHRLIAARVLARQQKHDEAIQEANAALGLARTDNERRQAREIVEWIERSRAAAAGRASSPRQTATPSSAVEASAPAPPRADLTQPIFRQLQPGEERLNGTLTRIECSGRAAVFHVQTADGAIRVRAPRLQDVEFITYREDVGGSVGCGPVKESWPVYVTWRPSTDAAAEKIAVAIEVLPKSTP